MSRTATIVANTDLPEAEALGLIARALGQSVEDGRPPRVELEPGVWATVEADEIEPGFPLNIDVYDSRGEDFARSSAQSLREQLIVTLGWKVLGPDEYA